MIRYGTDELTVFIVQFCPQIPSLVISKYSDCFERGPIKPVPEFSASMIVRLLFMRYRHADEDTKLNAA